MAKQQHKQVKEKKKMDPTTKKAIIFVVVIIVVMAILGVVLSLVFKGDKETSSTETKNTLSALDKYGYTLDDSDTELYKEEFNILKKNLESKEIDFDGYAESLAKLFVIDLYTISNKINKYDVGGTEFVFPDALENYKLNVEDTIYKYVEDNSKGKRDQDLPTVTSITIDKKESTTYTYKPDSDSSINKDYDAYDIKYSVEYEKDLGYDEDGELIIIKDGDFLYVVEKK